MGYQTNVTVPLQPQCPEAEVIQHLYKSEGEIKMPPRERLDAFRALVGGAKVGSVTVGEDVAKVSVPHCCLPSLTHQAPGWQYIQDDFVKERQQSSSQAEKMTSENLILRMTIAR